MVDEFVELGCPVCGGSLHRDGGSFRCGDCEFHGVVDDGFIDLRADRTHGAALRDVDHEPSCDENDDVRLVWQLFWPSANSGAVLHVGFGNREWHWSYPPSPYRVYVLQPTWQGNVARAGDPPDTSIVRVASANAPRLPFHDDTMALVSIIVPDQSRTLSPERPIENADLLLNLSRSSESYEVVLFEEVRRVLKTDGTLLLFAPNAFSYHVVFSKSALAPISRSIFARIRSQTCKSAGHGDGLRPQPLRGYRSMLRRTGFTKIYAIGFLDVREPALLAPIDDAIPSWDSRASGSVKGLIKSHKWFVPSFGIRASTGRQSATCWEQMLQQLSLANPGARDLRFQRCLLTGKNKAVFFGCADGTPLLLKVPLDEGSRVSERRNWSFLERARRTEAAKAPRPNFRGEAQGFEFFVESRVVGTSVSELVDRKGEATGIELVADYLRRLYGDSPLVPTQFDTSLLRRFVNTPIESLASVAETNGRLDELSSYLHAGLEGRPAMLGLTHGDLSVSNVFVGERSVTGVIDWADFNRDGLPALDVIGHAESRLRRARNVPLTSTISIILDGDPDDRIRAFIEGFTPLLRITPETFACYVYLYWLHHMRLRLNEASNRGDGRIRSQMRESVERLRPPSS